MASLSPNRRVPRAIAAAILTATSVIAIPAAAQSSCFERLDNGVDMTGWHKSTTNHHGPGDGWVAEDGALVGRQTAGQLGGILMTEKTYRDVEVLFDVKIDWGCDSGLFFRTTAGDRAYQVNVDHLAGAGIGTIWGEEFTAELRARDYTLTDQGTTAIVEPGHTPIFDLSQWPTMWHPTDFNPMRARIEGNPPRIQVWISEVKVMDFTDGVLRTEVDPSGPLAIQVHAGNRWAADGAVRFKNIRARDLTVDCSDAGNEAGAADAGETGAVGGAGSGACPASASGTVSLGGGCSVAAARHGGKIETLLFFLCAMAGRRKRQRKSAASVFGPNAHAGSCDAPGLMRDCRVQNDLAPSSQLSFQMPSS
jgi:hypothetical protein